MKKILLSIMSVFVLSSVALSPMTTIVEAATADSGMHLEQKLIGSNGILTPTNYGSKQCNFLEDFSTQMNERIEKSEENLATYQRAESKGILDTSSILNNLVIDGGFMVVNAITGAAKAAGSGQCGTSMDESTENPNSFLNTVFNQTQIFTQMSNITYIGGLMKFIGIGQWFAILLMMFFILFKGYQAFSGKQIDPIGLILRFMATMFLIYLAPYLLQDILNINNILTHYLSTMKVDVEGFQVGISEVLPASIIVMVTQIHEMMSAYVVTLSQTASDTVGENTAANTAILSGASSLLLLVVMVVIILVMMIVPFFKLVLWWYIRYFKIFVMAAIAPFMFLTFADEETEGTGYNFLKNFSVTVFEQFFMVIGIALTGIFIANALPLMESMNLGLIGSGIAIYAALSFLGTLPEMIGEWFRGGGSGVRTAPGQMMSAMSGSAKTLGKSSSRTASTARSGAQSLNWRVNARNGSSNEAVKTANAKIKENKSNERNYGKERAKAMKKPTGGGSGS